MRSLGTQPQPRLVGLDSETLLWESSFSVSCASGPRSAALCAPRPAAHPRPLHAASRLHCSQGIPKQVFMNSILHFNKLCILDAVSDLQKKITQIIQRGSHKPPHNFSCV